MLRKTKRFSLRLGNLSINSPAMLYISNLTQSDRPALFAQPIQLARRSLLYVTDWPSNIHCFVSTVLISIRLSLSHEYVQAFFSQHSYGWEQKRVLLE